MGKCFIIVLKLTSQNEFSGSSFIYLVGGKIFSCQYLDLNLTENVQQKFWKSVDKINNNFTSKPTFE